MNAIHRIIIAGCFTLILFLGYILIPGPTSALRPLGDDAMLHISPSNKIASVSHEPDLKPLDEEDLEELSPAIKEETAPPMSPEQRLSMLKAEFDGSICFQKCHQRNDFSPKDKTRKQWQLLIEKNGHDVFEKLTWENHQKKEYVLLYLYENAKNSDLKSEGIGVWKP